MGQAKQRGSLEDRIKCPNPPKVYPPLSPEVIEAIKADIDKMLKSFNKSLFGPRKPKKIKQRKVKTGG